MKKINLYFQIHQPYRLIDQFKLDQNLYDFDQKLNEEILIRVIKNCYRPMIAKFLSLCTEYPNQFKVTLGISGTVIEQLLSVDLDLVLDLKKLLQLPNTEVLSETYSHSLCSLANTQEFTEQIFLHKKTLKETFGISPSIFKNTELIYFDELAEILIDLNYKSIFTEKVLGLHKHDSSFYCHPKYDFLILTRNAKCSDLLGFQYKTPKNKIDVQDYYEFLKQQAEDDLIIGWDIETFGEHFSLEDGIHDFIKQLFKNLLIKNDFELSHLNSMAHDKKARDYPILGLEQNISWATQYKDTRAWLGNDLQKKALNSVYSLQESLHHKGQESLINRWRKYLSSDHFYYMGQLSGNDQIIADQFNPYQSPYEAYMNYLNHMRNFRDLID